VKVRTVIVVDNITTTGTTLSEGARAEKKPEPNEFGQRR
jgi:predicted amidophosphoribosyltransferase